MNNIFKRINFRQPKYMLPAILYIPLLGTSYFFFDLFHTEKVEVQDKTLQTTEFLNPELPDAQIKGGDGIGSKYENMAKSWGKIQDYSAVDNIERDEPDNNQEEYESQYTEEDIALLDRQEKENDLAAEAAGFVFLKIPLQQIVGGKENLVFSGASYQLCPLCRHSCDHADRKLGREFFKFVFPVVDQRGRSHDQRSPLR